MTAVLHIGQGCVKGPKRLAHSVHRRTDVHTAEGLNQGQLPSESHKPAPHLAPAELYSMHLMVWCRLGQARHVNDLGCMPPRTYRPVTPTFASLQSWYLPDSILHCWLHARLAGSRSPWQQSGLLSLPSSPPYVAQQAQAKPAHCQLSRSLTLQDGQQCGLGCCYCPPQ